MNPSEGFCRECRPFAPLPFFLPPNFTCRPNAAFRQHDTRRRKLRFFRSGVLERRKRLLVCSGSTVSIFSTATGSLVSSLEGHTAVVVVPSSTGLSYCWTASVDGTICHWDFSVPECVKIIDLCLPIFSMVVPSILSPREEDGECYCLRVCSRYKRTGQSPQASLWTDQEV
ncbi:hypothetical protein AAZX31_11G072200 [Glycine max]|uniref:Uncharacterized protein n=2 Tax=Glycine subgen. Soja TaxID=1462606 RepID=K7LNI0_SOYBN|nr:uncharacterized protein LOC114373801 [Glycine soja]XP_040862572.1 uncharacterized protein LOC121172688 [Glycine max]KAG5123592.1 hypothetical protein JHK82_030329 [Glycine max]KAG5145015.1 hypothetical protein JHK84_030558 [Glycine max]KAH1158025.1 hypothetical protein GYH30_030322 [Glycine max]KRH28756.1 hypothetical protein GLYMA_11G074200v4 [Glycine max]RZB78784.1 Transmembrane and coiled-coil domain-containing protein 4 isoform B [Glycine soja]